MISKRLEVVGSVTVIMLVAALALGQGPLWAAPNPSELGRQGQELSWVSGWLVEMIAAWTGGTVESISQQDACSMDPDGAQCASTTNPRTERRRKAPERRQWLSRSGCIDGLGCISPPER